MTRCPCLIASGGSLAYYAGMASQNFFIVSDIIASESGFVRPGMFVVPRGAVTHCKVRNYFDEAEVDALLECAS